MRLVANVVVVIALVTAFGACDGKPPVGPTPDPTPTPTPTSSQQSVGCFSASNANAPTMCGILNSLGSPQADFILSGEVAIERAFWSGIPVRNVSVLNDCDAASRNAKADPVTRDILYGYHMYHSLVSQFGTDLPAAGVLAHEWGHQIQFNFNWFSNPVRPMELEADAFSGYYMALAKGWAWTHMNTYFQAVYSFGDTNFNSPGHHGTPTERSTMARVGFDTAVQAYTFNRPFNYNELHQIFYQAISTLRLGQTASREISDPVVRAAAIAVANGQAKEILSGQTKGADGRVPGSLAERQRIWPKN